jgi:hypothetical protein
MIDAGVMIPTAVISARGEERLRRGHPWIYRSDVLDVAAEAGSVVEVLGPRQRFLGRRAEQKMRSGVPLTPRRPSCLRSSQPQVWLTW